MSIFGSLMSTNGAADTSGATRYFASSESFYRLAAP
jgi:hypothetical protein